MGSAKGQKGAVRWAAEEDLLTGCLSTEPKEGRSQPWEPVGIAEKRLEQLLTASRDSIKLL